jgi:LmbE family N-acetylglucosaminyl deacetylase
MRGGFFKRPLLTPDQYESRRRRFRRRRIAVYGSLGLLLYGFWVWVPWNIDLVSRKPDPPLPKIDPDTTKLFAPGTRVLLITAHPDDSEYYIGGTLLKLGKTAVIRQVIVTDGDKSFYWIFADSASNRVLRHAEAQRALRAWHGDSLVFLGYPDGRLKYSDELVDRLVAEIRSFKPDYILGFDPDYPPRISHADHRRAGEATLAAAKKAGIGTWLMLFSSQGQNYVDEIDAKEWPDRMDLLKIHASQWTGKKLAMIQDSITGDAMNDWYGKDDFYGEPFRCLRISGLR